MNPTNGYNIIRTKKCRHFNLRFFKRDFSYTCLNCGSRCQFCESCEKAYTLSTLKKHGGICGKCDNSKPQQPSSIPFTQLQIPMFFQLPLIQQQVQPEIPCRPQPVTPVSEMRMDTDENLTNSDDESVTSTVKNILAEDPYKKLWLVEWDNEEHATWEEYNTIKDSIVFKEYIERQMMVREN